MPRKLSEEEANTLFDEIGSPTLTPFESHKPFEAPPLNLDKPEATFDTFSFVIPGEPLASNNLRFNKTSGQAYRPKAHKQRIFSVHEYTELALTKENVRTFPLFEKGTPLWLIAKLVFPHRKADYRAGRRSSQLKPNAPKWVTVRKDIDNILKPLKDGMSGVIYQDDSQICEYRNIIKVYGTTPQTEITIGVLTNDGFNSTSDESPIGRTEA